MATSSAKPPKSPIWTSPKRIINRAMKKKIEEH